MAATLTDPLLRGNDGAALEKRGDAATYGMLLSRLGWPRALALLSLACASCTPVTSPASGPACGTVMFSREIEISGSEAVDLVLVIDNTPGMERAQQTLMNTLPGVLRALLSGDHDGDGVAENASVRSIHLGVITTDMGTGMNAAGSFAGCQRPSGDDGRIGHVGGDIEVPAFVSFAWDGDLGAVDEAARHVVDVGTDGCVFRQPLEALLKAVTAREPPVSYYDQPNPTFRDATTGEWNAPGHAADAHAGFFRRGAALSVVVMTRGDDCSARDERIFMDTPKSNALWGRDAQLRCTRAQSTLRAIERYTEGLGLRRNSPFSFGMIVGIPEAWETPGDRFPRFDLSDPLLEAVETGDPANPIQDICTPAVGPGADPPRRMLTLFNELSNFASTSIASICSDDYTPAFESAFHPSVIYYGDGSSCLPRAVPRNARGLIDCEITETMAPLRLTDEGIVTHCADVEGRTLIDIVTVNGEPRERCRVVQLTAEEARVVGAAGWWYRDVVSDPDYIRSTCGYSPQTIGFTPRGRPVAGTLVQLECTQRVTGFGFGQACLLGSTPDIGCAAGMVCDPDEDVCNARPVFDAPLECDLIDRVCAITCTTDADCTAGNLDGYVCDLRTNEEVASEEVNASLTPEQRSRVRGVCVNPNCE